MTQRVGVSGLAGPRPGRRSPRRVAGAVVGIVAAVVLSMFLSLVVVLWGIDPFVDAGIGDAQAADWT